MTPKYKYFIPPIKIIDKQLSCWSNKEEPIHKVMEYLSIPVKQRNISCSSDFKVSEAIMISSTEKSDEH